MNQKVYITQNLVEDLRKECDGRAANGIFFLVDENTRKLCLPLLMKDEFFIPSVISKALETNKATVKVFKNADKWYGITYREDLEEVKEAIGGYVENGLYEGI